MKPWQKVTIGIFGSLLVLTVVGGFIFYRLLAASLPLYEGTLKAEGLKDNVEIYRDSLAVAYIFANNEEDAAFAMGYLHAQERMFMMDLIRRAGEGRLSEVLGIEALPFDMMFRTVGIERTAEMILQKMNPEARRLLEAYSKGVNLYIKQAVNNYTFEFDVLGYQPEEWTPVHSIIVVRMMAWELNISWWTDLMFTDLVQKLGKDKVEDIFPEYSENGATIIPDEIEKFAQINTSLIQTDRLFREFIGSTGTHIGSNNWVVNAQKSVSGSPVIANDPHLAFSAPGKWYAVVINSPEWNVAGVSLPGAPGIVIGKNENISWVLTNIMLDDCDFYLEKLDSSETKYLLDGEWKDLNIIEDTIFVKDAKPVPVTIKSTHRGPIISEIYPYNFVYNEEHKGYPPMSIRWLGNEFSDETYALLKINKAKNWQEFKEGVQLFNVPGQNFVYADKEGNIGYLFGGALPIRSTNNISFVFDGTTSENDWKGFVDRNKLPALFNPPQNYIASANNKTVKEFKYHISNLWEPSSRIDRITELIKSKEKHSPDDFKKYQMDFVSLYAKKIVKYILNAFNDVKITDENLKLSLELLKEWNYEIDKYSQAPAIYLTTFKYLMKNIYEDEMGSDLFNQFVFMANVPYRSILKVLNNPSSAWWDDVNTEARENRDEIIRKSVADALTFLESKFGKEVKEWQWGKLHKVVFKHPFSGNVSLLDKFINIGPYEIGGDGTTLFNTEYPFSESIEKYPVFRHEEFENDLGPSMRFIYDFANPDEFYLILTTGQSGNVISDHYDDMTLMWLEGKYMKISTDENKIKNPANKLLILSP